MAVQQFGSIGPFGKKVPKQGTIEYLLFVMGDMVLKEIASGRINFKEMAKKELRSRGLSESSQQIKHKGDIMRIEEQIDKYLISEGSVSTSEYLVSIYKKQDKISKEEATAIVKGLEKVADEGTKYVVSYGAPFGKKTPQIVVIRDDNSYNDAVGKAIGVVLKNGFKIVSSKASDGKRWTIEIDKAGK